MRIWKLGVLALALGIVVAASGCGTANRSEAPGHFAIAVTPDGFEPAEVRVTAGTPVTLAVTRKTDKTCATEMVIADYGIQQKLPLNQTVEVTFTPKGPGEIRFACGMDMVAGKVIVQ